MSNVISIKGYTLHVHNNEPMVQDLELAKKLGYKEPRAIKKLIKRMVEAGQLAPETVWDTVSQTPSGGRPSQVYHLSEKAALKVITRSETTIADQITDEMIDVFIDARQGKPKQRHVDPLIAKNRQAVSIARTTVSLGKILGTDKAMLNVIVADNVKKATGMDITPLLPHKPVEEEPVTPTVLGKQIGLSGKAVNTELQTKGFQTKNAVGDWQPTEKGKSYCTVNPYKSPNSDHTGYRIMWYPKVSEHLSSNAA